jgi:hypothetical protein
MRALIATLIALMLFAATPVAARVILRMGTLLRTAEVHATITAA